MPQCFTATVIDRDEISTWIAIEQKAPGGCQDACIPFAFGWSELRNFPSYFSVIDIERAQIFFCGVSIGSFRLPGSKFDDTFLLGHHIIQTGDGAERFRAPIGSDSGADF